VAAARGYTPDGLTETLEVFEFFSFEDIRTFISASVATFMAKDDWGIVLFLYSVMLSRTLAKIVTDRDELASTMIGRHGYCTQEMVNLCLCGTAVSNVFDGDKSLDGTVFKGVKSRSELGYLSLFEHYNNLEVGHYYKTPELPIWIICSESHYTTLLFLGSAMPATKMFDVFYYDQQANQSEEIRLTIDLTIASPAPREQIEPPINDVLRTKWGKHARVNWNGTDPIL
jgi:ubiquitin carboxyl-terminal hydrolase MINDY-3/4